MVGLEKCNPVRFQKNQDWTSVENFFSKFFDESFFSGIKSWSPSSDVLESDSEVRIHMDVPGLRKEDLDIQLAENNTLVIRGERKFGEQEGSKFHRRERFYGSFNRTFLMPSNVELDKINATFKDGVLEVVLPKAESARARKIEIKSN